MIFASDLDRTLIYSRRFIKEILEEDLICVELYDKKDISYMTRKSLELLKEISSQLIFIPITTRTKEQYLRLKIFDNTISNKYAVASNGGSIFIDKKLDMEWENIVNEELRKCEDIKKVIETHKEMVKDESIIKYRPGDDKFFYNIIDLDKRNNTPYDEFDEYLSESGWSKYDQGRKVYYVPDTLTKSKALMHIMKRENIKNTIVAGDSFLDLSMLEMSSKGFVPLHGELAVHLNNHHKQYINLISEGFKGTEEFLNIIKNICSTV